MQQLLPYVWCYVAIGIALWLFFTATYFKPENWNFVWWRGVLIGALLMAAFWPVCLMCIAILVVTDKLAALIPPPDKSALWKRQLTLSAKDRAELSDAERSHIARAAANGEDCTTFFSHKEDFADVLNLFWEEQVLPESYRSFKAAREGPSDSEGELQFVLHRRTTPEWYVGFSSEFVKSIAKLDKTTRARVLEAIAKLAEAPVTAHGDTVKPLTGNLSGLWRYRIGDDRLVYKPNALSKQVVLLSFGSRGGVYEHDN